MKPDTGTRERGTGSAASQADAPPSAVKSERSEIQRQVVRCLEEASAGLTAKQIQARVPESAADLDATLEELVRLRVIIRLNTVIPSYCSRAAGAPVVTD